VVGTYQSKYAQISSTVGHRVNAYH